MITITNNIEKIKISNKELEKYDNYYKGLKIEVKNDYFLIELIILKENEDISEIIKIRKNGEEILDRFKNRGSAKNTIVLSNYDFNKFKNLYNNMQIKNNLRKEMIINIYSEMLSYEYYQTYLIEDTKDIILEDILNYELPNYYAHEEYKKEIIKESKKKIKDKYGINE